MADKCDNEKCAACTLTEGAKLACRYMNDFADRIEQTQKDDRWDAHSEELMVIFLHAMTHLIGMTDPVTAIHRLDEIFHKSLTTHMRAKLATLIDPPLTFEALIARAPKEALSDHIKKRAERIFAALASTEEETKH